MVCLGFIIAACSYNLSFDKNDLELEKYYEELIK